MIRRVVIVLAFVGLETVQRHVIMALAPIMIVRIVAMEAVQDVAAAAQVVPLVVQVDAPEDVAAVAQVVLQDVQDVRILVKHYVIPVALIV